MQKHSTTIKRTSRRKDPQERAAERMEQRIGVARQRVAEAVAEIINNPQTPAALFNSVTEFIVEGCAGTIKDLWTAPALEHLILFVQKKEVGDAS